MSLARRPRSAVESLGLLGHPLVKLAVENDAELKPSRKLGDASEHLGMALQLAIYRVDLEHMFQDLSAVSSKNRRETLKVLRHQQVASGNLPPRARISYDAIVNAARLQHFREIADPTLVYSLRVDSVEGVASRAVESLQDYFENLTPHAQDVGQPIVYFRLLKARPARQKQVRVAAGARRRIDDKQMAVYLLTSVLSDGNRVYVRAELGGHHGDKAVALLAGLRLNDSMRSWTVKSHVLTSAESPGEDLRHGMSEVLTRLMQGPISIQDVAWRGYTDAMDALASRGLIQRCEERGVWQLEAEHVPSLQYCLELHNETPCLKPRQAVDIDGMTLFELLSAP